MKALNEAKVLRFASGEMDAEEESAFLAQCEIASASWREVVLAVAEHRHIVEMLGEFAASDNQPRPAARGTKQGVGRWRSVLAAALMKVPMTAAAALVAGLLLGIIGTRMASPSREHEAQIVIAPPAIQMHPAEESFPSVAQSPQPSVQLPPQTKQSLESVAKLSPNSFETSAVAPSATAPIADARNPSDLLRMNPMIPEAQRVVLGKNGFQVEEEPTLYVIKASNGTQWAFPTQRATLHYVKR